MAKVDADWIVAQIDKYIACLDQLPQQRPLGGAEGCSYFAAGLRDMAASVREGILQEASWADAQTLLGSLFPEIAQKAPHGWEVVLEPRASHKSD